MDFFAMYQNIMSSGFYLKEEQHKCTFKESLLGFNNKTIDILLKIISVLTLSSYEMLVDHVHS